MPWADEQNEYMTNLVNGYKTLLDFLQEENRKLWDEVHRLRAENEALRGTR